MKHARIHSPVVAFIVWSALSALGCASNPQTVDAPTVGPSATNAGSRGSSKTYDVRLVRPSRVGEREHFVTDHTELMVTKVTRDGAQVSNKREKLDVHMDAVSTMVAVDARGRGTRVRLDIAELTVDGQRVAAKTIQLTRHGKSKDAEIDLDGKPVSDELRKALKAVIKLGLDGAGDDEIFGPKTPQAIGARWNIDEALAIESLKEENVFVAAVKGDVSLESITKIDGVDCLNVRATMDMHDMQIPNLPPDSVTEASRAQAEMTAALPVDGRIGRVLDRMDMKMSFRIRVPSSEGAPLIVTVEGTETQTTHQNAL